MVLTAEAIEYNGVKYAKVEDKAQVGDIIRYDIEHGNYLTDSGFYEVARLDSFNDPQITFDDGVEFDLCGREYDTFRKVTEPVTESPQQYREVKRKAIKGERIRIVKRLDNRYENGDEFEVDEANDGGIFVKHPRGNNNGRAAVFHSEYVVLEPIAPIAKPSDDLIVVDGVTYRKVDRKPKVGDFVYATDKCTDITKGKVYDVIYVHSDGDACFRDNVGDQRLFTRTQYGRILVERVADQPQTTEQLSAQVTELQTKLAEAEKQLAEKQSEEAKVAATNRLKVGEYAKVLNQTDGYSHVGDIVKITEDDRSHIPFNTVRLNGEYSGWHCIEDLVRATDEEVAEAKRKLAQAEEAAQWAKIGRKVGEFKKGDIVESLGICDGHVGETVGVVIHHDSNRPYVRGTYKDGRVLNLYTSVKLIAPVEAVVNLTVSA